MAAIGWHGPLIDLSTASSHLDDFVQLIVFVRSCEPIQRNNASKEGKLLKTNIQVGDDTMSYFSVSLWQNHVGTAVFAGDFVLLQNIKIVKFRDVLEASTAQTSGVTILIHSSKLTSLTGTDEIFTHSHLGERTRGKLRRVVRWVQHTESAFQHIEHRKWQPLMNWKTDEEKKLQNCISISEVSNLTTSCNAIFFASVGEIFFPSTGRPSDVKEQIFTSKKLLMKDDNKVVEDLIFTGCKLCGYLISSRKCLLDQDKTPLFCQKSCKYLHEVCPIYRPFLLQVWDETGRIPLLVRNKAAEILFGDITAETVYNCYKEEEQKNQIPVLRCGNKPRFHHIWLILIRTLLQQGSNSPFRFEVAVDREKDIENGRFELVSFVMPCYKNGES